MDTFQIVPGNDIDGAMVTDGTDVKSADQGPTFPNRVFIAQDGNDNEVPAASKSKMRSLYHGNRLPIDLVLHLQLCRPHFS